LAIEFKDGLFERSPACLGGRRGFFSSIFTGDTLGATQIPETRETELNQSASRGLPESPWPPFVQVIDCISNNKVRQGTKQEFSRSIVRQASNFVSLLEAANGNPARFWDKFGGNFWLRASIKHAATAGICRALAVPLVNTQFGYYHTQNGF
jgi:hypothetical protein